MNDGAPPRPDPKAIRPSIVDAGWSVPPPAVAPEAQRPGTDRPLPSYDAPEPAGVREVTMVDREVHSRAKAMREKDTLPPPRRASAFPPAGPPPPPPIVRSQPPPAAPVSSGAAYVPKAAAPPGSRPSSRPPFPNELVAPPPAAAPARVAVQPQQPAPTRQSLPPVGASHSVPPAPAPAQRDDPTVVAAARSAATIVRPRPSHAPALPSFAAALGQRVRFAGGEVPLWTLVTPLVVLVALGAAFAAAAVTSAAEPSASPAPLKATAEPSASLAPIAPLPPPPAPVVSASPEEKPKPLSLLERAASGESGALKQLAERAPAELGVEEAIALSLGQSAERVHAVRVLRERVAHDPGLIKDPALLAELRKAIDDPETARDALAAMASVPGPISADLIYEVWTVTTARTAATDLARALSYSKEIRAKASKALAVALDLREADTCEKSRALLPRATSDGDRRALHSLNKLTRKYGCGPNKRQDCYACLREGDDLDAALKASKVRREPHPFGGG